MGIRFFKPSDSDAVLRLHAEVFKTMNLASFSWEPCQQIESLEKDCIKHVYGDEKVKGYGAAYRLDETHFRLNLLVDPRDRKRGIGSALLEEIETEVKKEGGKYLQARTLERMDESLAFALSRGFVEIHRMRGMSLRAKDFSYLSWGRLGEKLAALGFSETTFSDEEEAGNDPVDKLAELHKNARKGWPLPDPTWRFDATPDWLRSGFTNVIAPELFSIMKFKKEYVGFTNLDSRSMVGTGVHPRYRGLGIGTYLKACNIKRCVDAGQEYFESCTANPAMMRVNEKLGYKFTELTEVRFVKYL